MIHNTHFSENTHLIRHDYSILTILIACNYFVKKKQTSYNGKCPTNKVKPRLCAQGLSAKGGQTTLRLNRDRVHFVLCLNMDNDQLVPRMYGGEQFSVAETARPWLLGQG